MPDPSDLEQVFSSGCGHSQPRGAAVVEPLSVENQHPQRRSSGRGPLVGSLIGYLAGRQSASLLVSIFLHIGAVFLLSLLVFVRPIEAPQSWLDGAFEGEVVDTLDLDVNELQTAGGEIYLTSPTATTLAPAANSSSQSLVDPLELDLQVTPQATATTGAREALGELLASRGGGMSGRNAQNRRSLALAGGGTAASESAVERGLAWLAAHQFEDGGWRFDLESCPQCQGACRDSGVLQSTTGSTGLALLSFLGAGYTQHEGPYQEVIANGLYYLSDKMLITSDGGDLRDRSVISTRDNGIQLIHKNGSMYSHAIATLALCEAYAMSRDSNLAKPAQRAVDFIVYAQHEKGGWRYEPKQPGDLSVTGWQITALKSALLAKLDVPREVWYRASDYLDSVQEERGATYGYQRPSTTQKSMSAVGLLSRMMLGWPHDHRPLRKGMVQLAKESPEKKDMYFNYYATQALHHHGGSGWKRWNLRMRDYLVDSQATEGHETGSWYFDEKWSERGGRLYTTTLAILTLEVYYRYMPMYQEAFVEDAP